MPVEDSKKDSHDRIVQEVLPNFADKLKKEGLITAYDRKPFVIKLYEDPPSIKIKPDLVLYLSEAKKVLVEIVNSKDPKRFIGEIIYACLLGCDKKIDGFVFFVLRFHGRAHTRGMIQKSFLDRALKESIQLHTIGVTWAEDDDTNYQNLRWILTLMGDNDTN